MVERLSVSACVLTGPSCADVPVESLRLRFALLQSLNNTLESFFLPLVELRQTHTYQNSIAALLAEAKGQRATLQLLSTSLRRTLVSSPSHLSSPLSTGLVFYDTKVTVMNRVLNATVQRTVDHAAPEITLDPLEMVGGERPGARPHPQHRPRHQTPQGQPR